MATINSELAEKEFRTFLKKKYGDDKKIGDNPDVAELIVGMLSEGRVILNPDGTIKYVLIWPLMKKQGEKEVPHLSELTFKQRLKLKDLKPYGRMVDPSDRMSVIYSYICAYTSTPRALLEEMDMSDINKLQAIAVFFMQ